MPFVSSLLWFRRDLRVLDHAALHHALRSSDRVYCVFTYDTDILDALPRQDRRVEFIHACVAELEAELRALGGYLIVRHGSSVTNIPELAQDLGVEAVFCNHDYEPQAIARDASIAARLTQDGRRLLSYKDQVVFEKDEVLAQGGTPFSVFTPYKKAWLKRLHAKPEVLAPWTIEPYASHFAPPQPAPLPGLAALGFAATNLHTLALPSGMSGAAQLFEDFCARMAHYGDARDYPALKGPSYLSVHLRFGTISIRYLVRSALQMASSGAEVWLSELIWREFYMMILYQHPRVAERAFKPAYDAIVWEHGLHADANFAAWCGARTGYPLVDAAMAQLNQTGYMHNRLRMLTASFLIKDLGIDWRRGEAYFALHLNDFDLAANNGGWQWAASSGCDAQPYFRIFNPVTQSEKFDAEGRFIRRYQPQLAHLDNKAIHQPHDPIVQHDEARQRSLARYAVVKRPGPPDPQ